ncbi:MAG TPA: trypsin-like serine protease [Pyrinomonadaceae bacterium]
MLKNIHITTILGLALTLVGGGIVLTSKGQNPEKTGQVEQKLVNGQILSQIFQEDYALLTITSANLPPPPPAPATVSVCSASLLTNDWVVTAAHCLSAYNVGNPGTVTVTANWTKPQQRQGVQVVIFGSGPNLEPWDVALIRVSSRFILGNSEEGFEQRVWLDGPYDPNLLGTRIEMVGQGFYAFASGVGNSATPSQGDGQYRYGTGQVGRIAEHRYWYAAENGQMIGSGDSGGASFARVYGGRALIGVHSRCHSLCLPGKMCTAADPWTWVMATPDCGDAPLQPIWNQIQQTIAANRTPITPLGPNNPDGTFDPDYKACNPLVYIPSPDAPSNRISQAWGDRGFWDKDRINVRIQESPNGSGLFNVAVRESNPPNTLEFSAQQVQLTETPTFQYTGPVYELTPTTVPNASKTKAGRLGDTRSAPPAPPRDPGRSNVGAAGPGLAGTRLREPNASKLASRFDRSFGLSLSNGIRLEVDIECDEKRSPRIYQVRYMRNRDAGERVVDVILKFSQPPAR